MVIIRDLRPPVSNISNFSDLIKGFSESSDYCYYKMQFTLNFLSTLAVAKVAFSQVQGITNTAVVGVNSNNASVFGNFYN